MVKRKQARAPEPPRKEVAMTICEWSDPETGECCPRQGVFGIGPPLRPKQSWWCPEHIPENYWRRD